MIAAAASALAVLTFNRISELIADLPDLTLSSWEILTSDGDALGASGELRHSLWRKSVLWVEQAFGILVATTSGLGMST